MGKSEYEFDGRAKSCAACSRELVPGDEVTSLLFVEEGRLVRRDFCAACSAGARTGGEFSSWRSVVPAPEDEESRKKKRLEALLDPAVLMDVLRETRDSPDPSRRRFRFVLALMLMRRKKLKLVELARRELVEGAGPEPALVLREAGRGARPVIEVADVKMSEAEMLSAQDEVGSILAFGGVRTGRET